MKKIKKVAAIENVSKLLAAVSFVIFGLVGVLFLNNSFAAPKNSQSTTIVKTYITSTQRLNVGQTVDVNLRLDTLGQPVSAVQANIKYDARYFDFVNVDNTGSPFEIQAQSDGSIAGSVKIARGSIAGVSGDQLIAIVKLKTKATTRKTTISYASGTEAYNKDTVTNILQGTYGYSYSIR
jgi:hypothetical protein